MRASLISRIASVVAAAVAAFAVALPLWWVFVSSTRPGNTFVNYMTPLSWKAFIPAGGELSNYSVLLSGDFARALANSFIVAGATVVVGLVVAVLAAYALAVLDFPGRGEVFAFIIVVSMVPFDAIAIPLSGLFSTWKLDDSYAGLILPALANGFSIFVLRRFFLGVPQELFDAAEVDGLSKFGALWRIVLPLSKPALIGRPDALPVAMAGIPVAAADRYVARQAARANRAGESEQSVQRRSRPDPCGLVRVQRDPDGPAAVLPAPVHRISLDNRNARLTWLSPW
jgi:multiple sugar transport system permease protein/putative chitobiose transport system permease protein